MTITPMTKRRADCFLYGMMSGFSKGLAAGLAATVPMTAVMEFLHRRLPARQRYALPPRQITQRLTRKVGVEQELDEPEHQGLALAAHFGYGAATGSIYGVLADALEPKLRQVPLPPAGRAAAQGMIYGFLVWAGSYLGLLPALGILAPATRHPKERNALMIAAHLVWGATLGLLSHSQNHTKGAGSRSSR